MASGAFVFPDLARLNFFSATNLLGASASGFKLALIKSTWAPVQATHEIWADASAQEIAPGGGYATGGIALAGVVLSQTSGTVKFTCSNVLQLASGGSIAAWRYGLVYFNGTLNSKVKPLVGYFLGDSSPADIPATSSGTYLSVAINASGIVSVG